MGLFDGYFPTPSDAMANRTSGGTRVDFPSNVAKVQQQRIDASKNNMTRVGNRTNTTSSFTPPSQAPGLGKPKGFYGLSDYLPALVRDLIEVDHSRDDLLLGDDFTGRGIFIHELFLGIYSSIWFIDLMHKTEHNGTWRVNLPGYLLLVAGGVLQSDAIRRPNLATRSKGENDPKMIAGYLPEQYADIGTLILVSLSGAWFVANVPYGRRPPFFTGTRAKTAALLATSQWTWSRTIGKVVNKII